MRLSLRGFATLSSMAIMVLLVTYLSIGASASASVELDLQRAPQLVQSQAWSSLDAALKLLADTWDPTKQTFSAWSSTHPVSGLSWRSASGRLNLNTISPFTLGLPAFRATLKETSLESFVEKRSLAGPSSDGRLFSELIEPNAFSNWYTVHSLWNLDTADEVMIESMTSQRTGSPAVGSALRATLRGFREKKHRLTTSDWQSLKANGASELEPLVTLEPELDVNEAPEALLSALLENPAWELVQPKEKLRALLSARLDQPLTNQRLMAILQLKEGNLLLSYLGVRTRFLEGEVGSPAGRLTFAIYLPGENPSSVKPRITSTRWSNS